MLLQNEGGLLPLNAEKARRVAVIGPHSAEVMLGGYAGVPRHSVSILEGIRKRLGKDATVAPRRGGAHHRGLGLHQGPAAARRRDPLAGRGGRPTAWCPPTRPRTARRIAEAVALARDSDVAIVVVGDNEQTAREAYAENHLGDRADLRLVGQQEELVRAVLDTGKPTVVVLINGRPPAIPELAETVPGHPRSAGTSGRRAAPRWPRCSSAT